MLLYQSSMPAAAGTPRYENWVRWLRKGSGVICVPHPTPAGDKPQRYISLGTLGSRCSGDGGWRRRPAPELIPDRSPGHAFLPRFMIFSDVWSYWRTQVTSGHPC